MLFEVPSRKSLADIDAALKDSAARHSFGIITVHDLKQTMQNKGVEFDRDCMIYEVCNPHHAKKVLEENGAVSTALPCRISVYGAPGDYHVATLAPTIMMKAFGGGEKMEQTAREVEQVVFEMIKESA